MKNWLKYFFGAFFSHSLAKEGEWRSLSNAILAFILGLLIAAAGLCLGRVASYNTFYDKALDFKNFAYENLVKKTPIEISDGKARFDGVVNSYLKDGENVALNDGYNVIIDTRDIDRIYDDFNAYCIDENGDRITYEDYLSLVEDERSKYVFKAEYSGVDLDYASDENFNKYYAYLEKSSDKNSRNYSQEIAEMFKEVEEAEKTSDYREIIYCLYVRAYYPQLSQTQNEAQYFTRKGYYDELRASDSEEKYILLYQNSCYVSFFANENQFSYIGDFSKKILQSIKIDDSVAVDLLLKSTFKSKGFTDFAVYVLNLWRIFVFVLFGWFALSLIIYLISKKIGIECSNNLSSAFLIVGSFLTVSGIIGGLLGFAVSFFTQQTTAFGFGVIVIVSTWIIRTVIFLIRAVIEAKNNKDTEKAVEVKTAEEAQITQAATQTAQSEIVEL